MCLGLKRDLLELAIDQRSRLSSVLDISTEESSEGELAAMVSFAIAFPDGFMALVDTYDVKRYFIQSLLGQILSDQNFLCGFSLEFYFSFLFFGLRFEILSRFAPCSAKKSQSDKEFGCCLKILIFPVITLACPTIIYVMIRN